MRFQLRLLIAAALVAALPGAASAQTLPHWGRPLTPVEARALQDKVVQLSKEKGVQLALLTSIARTLGEKTTGSFSELIALVEAQAQKARETTSQVQDLERRMQSLSDPALRDPTVAALTRARLALDEGRLEDAGDALAALQVLRRSDLSDARDSWLEAVRARAAVASLALDHDAATRIDLAAADEARRDEAQDRLARIMLTIDAGLAQYAKSRISTNLGPLYEAERILRLQALPLVNRKSLPQQWAVVQFNLGVVMESLGERKEEARALILAYDAFQNSLQVWTRARNPNEWAGSVSGQAIILNEIGRLGRNTIALQRALALYAQIAEVRTQASDPEGWARLQTNRGNTLFLLGHLRAEAQSVRDAEAAFKASLQVFSLERDPLSWAAAQNSLALAESELGELLADPASVEAAVGRTRLILSVIKRESSPLEWAREQYNLGNMLAVLGAMRNDAATMRQSIACYEASLEVYDRDDPQAWAGAQRNLGVAWRGMDRIEPSPDAQAGAVAAANAALEFFTREHSMMEWAEIQHDLADLYRQRAVRDGACQDGRLAEQHISLYAKNMPAQKELAAANRRELASARALVDRLCRPANRDGDRLR